MNCLQLGYICVNFYCIIPALLGDSHYLFYWLVPAIQPRMLVTLDESLSSIGVSVRVGQVKMIMLWLGYFI